MLQVKLHTPTHSEATGQVRGVLFISYAHADVQDVLPFIEQLQPLVERERLELFFDARELKAGDVWNDKLLSALSRCELFVLMATPKCLTSRFCIERELLMALNRQRSNQCRIVPVVLRDCDWKGKLLPDGSGRCLSEFQALPAGGAAVAASAGAERDRVWLAIVNALAEVLADPATTAPPRRAQSAVPVLLPYLCDQVMPESGVRELLMRWRAQTGPLVVVLRAAATDCPDHFINRIDERHLRKLLPRLTPGVELQRHSGLQWLPPQSNLRDAPALQRWFLEQVVERVTGDPYASEDELLQRLRDEGANRLFIAGIPKGSTEFVRVTLQALGACLAKLSGRLDKVRLAAMLWSEDPALKELVPDASWHSADACIGLPSPLERFGRQAVIDWATLDEVQQFAIIDRTQLDEAFAGAADELSMREFAAIAQSLLQRRASAQ
ncbi:toll/interleukin-1 receptor domain-containing protein [Variovorax sp. YR216]|uniref:toll/interleukin-1 receptor domain-containing protein n=1 Tax=Variovorax sp. YR216 TaxID=1882828 RepID=UPI0008959BBA|nr:toll/interleukin-1 receptor domain-containing protein [Variovorax sp. YR216]SEB22698.1 TIR domain-containing protein [Variovorax sp. YR216]